MGIPILDDLLALFSASLFSTSFLNRYVGPFCPEVEPKFMCLMTIFGDKKCPEIEMSFFLFLDGFSKKTNFLELTSRRPLIFDDPYNAFEGFPISRKILSKRPPIEQSASKKKRKTSKDAIHE